MKNVAFIHQRINILKTLEKKIAHLCWRKDSKLKIDVLEQVELFLLLGEALTLFLSIHLRGGIIIYFLNCFGVLTEVFNVDPENIIDSAKSFIIGKNRGEWKSIGKFDVFLIIYNSNPSSLRASLDSFVFKYQDKLSETIFIIGDMYDLGKTQKNIIKKREHIVKISGLKIHYLLENTVMIFIMGLEVKVLALKRLMMLSSPV